MSGGFVLAGLFLLCFLLTLVAARLLLPVLVRRRAAQPILEIGPAWHLTKAGTPTLGGLFFLISVTASLLLASLAWKNEVARSLLLLLFFSLLSAGIGFLDDRKKLAKKENKGLSAPQKYFLQLLAAALFVLLARAQGVIDTAIRLPFFTGKIELGGFYYPLALIYLTGLENALNLTDGLDGLLASTTAVLAAFYLLYGLAVGEALLVTVGAVLLGAMLGFLCYNRHPAKVFMGDTGSLFLGALVSGAGLLVARPVTALLSGGVFVMEAASVILQVIFFKMTDGKRLFLMAPFHHHLEKRGYSENAVVLLFSMLCALFAALAFVGR